MATYENTEDPAALRAYLDGCDEGELVGQQIAQQGGIHAVEFLLKHGCTEALAIEMLTSLRQNMEIVVSIAQRKGFKRVFGRSVTGFN